MHTLKKFLLTFPFCDSTSDWLTGCNGERARLLKIFIPFTRNSEMNSQLIFTYHIIQRKCVLFCVSSRVACLAQDYFLHAADMGFYQVKALQHNNFTVLIFQANMINCFKRAFIVSVM